MAKAGFYFYFSSIGHEIMYTAKGKREKRSLLTEINGKAFAPEKRREIKEKGDYIFRRLYFGGIMLRARRGKKREGKKGTGFWLPLVSMTINRGILREHF